MPFKLDGAVDAVASKPFKLEGAQDAPPSEPGFMQRVAGDISQRKAQASKDIFQEDQSPVSAGLQGVGQYMAIGGDVAGEGAKSAVNAIPDMIKQPIISKAKDAATYIAKTDLGKAGISGALQTKQAWDNFSKDHPEAARNIGAIGNIVSAFPAGVGAAGAEKGLVSLGEAAAPGLKSGGEYLVKTANKQNADKFVELISPKITKKVAEENVGKTVEKGLLRKDVVIPDKLTQEVADTVRKVPGIDLKRSYQYNYNKIAAENRTEAKQLMKVLKSAKVIIEPQKITAARDNVTAELMKQSFMVGDAKKASKKMIKEVSSLMKKNGNTANGVLKTRQEFDIWAKSQIKGIADSEVNTARKASWTAIRNSLNGLVAEAVPDAKVRESLNKQSHLFKALNNIKPKAGAEGKNIISRGIQNTKDLMPQVPFLTPAAGVALAAPYSALKGLSNIPIGKTIGHGMTQLGDILKK